MTEAAKASASAMTEKRAIFDDNVGQIISLEREENDPEKY
jgi:hypothetical protein